jgi:uncharacterized protein with PIN domain
VNGLRVHFRFHGELNDFLLSEKRDVRFEHLAGATDTVKHVIESLGVPHTEIGRILINDAEACLAAQLTNGCAIEVFPHELPIRFADAPKFVLDGHLGRLAAYLRMLGFDTWYQRSADDQLLASVSHGEQRLLLTRDIGLLKRREVQLGYSVRADKPHDQLREISTRFDLAKWFAPFTRCMDCNGRLISVLKSEVEDLLPPHTRETKNEFSRCSDCRKIFWRGSHHARMLGWIQDLCEVSP